MEPLMAAVRSRGKSSKLAVTQENRAPLYHQLFLILRGRIHDGSFAAGSYLPGEKEVAAEYDVSRITANRALNELAAAGLVVREKGRGTRVRSAFEGKVSRGPTEFLLAGRGEESDENVLLHFAYEPAPPEVAAALDLVEGTEVQHAERSGNVGSRPYNHLTTYVPADIGRAWTRDDIALTPLRDLLTAAGVDVVRLEEVITATLADVALADTLKVAVGAPLLKVTRTLYDGKDRAVEYLIAFYPPDRYQYRSTLDRRKMGSGR
jgi:GntR family transcriptional regulator